MDYSDEDIIDIESGDDSLYNDEGSDLDFGFDEEASKRNSQVSYVVLNEEDIRKHQRDDIEQISTVLSISQVEAIVLLLHYQWSVSKVEDEWFTDEEKVRKTVGILKEPVVVDDRDQVSNIECKICFDLFLQKETATVSCGHPYCNTCWTGYMTSKINDGPGCLMVKCPEPKCCAVVGQDMINKVITEVEDKEKYYRYFLRSYVEGSGKKIKWCPSPGCGYAIEYGSGSCENYDVSCLCRYEFCWNCSENAHRPVDCKTVSKWILKNSDESENTNWILVNTKPCPNCKRSIQKSTGCNNMKCSICKHRFCWHCLYSLSNHKNCNKFEGDDESENKKIRAKYAIDKYTHYYERWASNQSSRLKAMGDLKKLKSVQLKKLSYNQSTPETQLNSL